MKLVCVISPFRATAERSQAEHGAHAQRLCRLVSLAGFEPFASHLFAPSFLDENVPKERMAGIRISKSIISRSDELWVWDAWGITTGMAAEIAHAQSENTKIARRRTGVRIEILYLTRGDIPAWDDVER